MNKRQVKKAMKKSDGSDVYEPEADRVETLKTLIINEAILLAKHKISHVRDLTEYALEYSELMLDKEFSEQQKR